MSVFHASIGRPAFVGIYGLAIGMAMVLELVPQPPPYLLPWIGVLALIACVLAFLARIRNIGWTPWAALLLLVPLVNLE